MKLLLDTHVWLWALLSDSKLGKKSQRLLESRDNELWLSPISLWEVALLVERKRLRIDGPFDRWVEKALHEFPVVEAPLTHAVAMAARTIRVPHEDPADRFLASAAHVFDLTLLTADEQLLAGRGFSHLACR